MENINNLMRFAAMKEQRDELLEVCKEIYDRVPPHIRKMFPKLEGVIEKTEKLSITEEVK